MNTIIRYLTIFTVNLILFIFIDLFSGTWYLKNSNQQFFTQDQEIARANNNRFKSNSYHHGFIKNSAVEHIWGQQRYPIFTNSLGMKDQQIREVALTSSKHRVLFLGDSFAEGVGLPYEQTYIGLLDKKLDPQQVELLNAAVMSYSPKLNYLKAQYLIEQIGLTIDEVYLFIDLSDIQDELVYQAFTPSQEFEPIPDTKPAILLTPAEQLQGYFADHSLSFHLVKTFGHRYLDWPQSPQPLITYQTPTGQIQISEQDYYHNREKWTTDDHLYQQWGQTGLELAAIHTTQLIELLNRHQITTHLIVYPWPHQIQAQDINSKQVTFWQEFAKQHHVDFINLFPQFFQPDCQQSCFITGDNHWNQHGHQVVTRALYPVILESSAR